MANYQYTGCVMGVTEGGVTQLIAPTEPQYPITRPVNAYTERLMGVSLLVGDISCIPTILEFIPSVTLPIGKDRIILRAVLEVNGNKTLNHNGNVGFADIEINTYVMSFDNNPAWIANYLFLNSGIDLMRQLGVNRFFDYSPYVLSNADQIIWISGMPANMESLEPTEEFFGPLTIIPGTVKLTFKVIDDLPLDAVDFTLQQWGQDTTVYGCGFPSLSEMPQ